MFFICLVEEQWSYEMVCSNFIYDFMELAYLYV